MFTALTAETGAGAVAGLATAAGAALIYARGCNHELPPSALPAPPFTGGQCSGVTYRVYVNANRVYAGGASGAPSSTPISTYGDVQGAVVGCFSVDADTSVSLTIEGATNAIPDQVAGISPADYGKWSYQAISITSVVRLDGLPDTCGNPPPVPPPLSPGDNVVNNNVTYVNSDGDTVTNNFNFVFGYAQVNLNGQLEIPVTIQNTVTPTLNVSGTLNLSSGNININLGDPGSPVGSGGGCTPDPANNPDTPPLPTGLPPSAPLPPSSQDMPEKRKILRGCVVTTTTVGSNIGQVVQGDDPTIYVPDLGLVSFLVQVGNFTAWSVPQKIQQTRQVIECPWPNGAIDVKGTPRPNCSFTITPIYTQVSYPRQYPPES